MSTVEEWLDEAPGPASLDAFITTFRQRLSGTHAPAFSFLWPNNSAPLITSAKSALRTTVGTLLYKHSFWSITYACNKTYACHSNCGCRTFKLELLQKPTFAIYYQLR